MHSRKHAAPSLLEEHEVKMASSSQAEVVVPNVQTLPPKWQQFLVENHTLERLKQACKEQKLKLANLRDEIRDALRSRPKARALFHVDLSLEGQFGACGGLKLAKRTRPEAFSEKRLEEVTLNGIAKVFSGKFSPDDLVAFGKEVVHEMLEQRKRTAVYTLETIARKGDAKSHKRQKKQE